jgi:hypothetical protein
MNPEQLQPIEKIHPQEPTESLEQSALSQGQVNELFAMRQQDLETIKAWIGLKFYYRAAEKVKQEEERLRKLLNFQQTKQTLLSEYSFVLDTAYFEQKFFNS